LNRFRALILLLALAAGRAEGQSIELRDAGPPLAARIVRRALAGQHVIIGPDTTPASVARLATIPSTLVVLGRDLEIDGDVRGDAVVIGGDLYLHPGARVHGEVVAIGGGVYNSTLAFVAGPHGSYRDFTYDVTRVAGGYVLSYRNLVPPHVAASSPIGFNGLRLPSYDRTNGLSLPVAPTFQLGALDVEPRLTYRSNLGRVDPAVAALYHVDRLTGLRASVARGTYSNDAWIWSDPVNSLETILLGRDMRNYFRATRFEVVIAHQWQGDAATMESYAGFRDEAPLSVGPWPGAQGGPWSLFGRHDGDDMLRPNPPVCCAGASFGSAVAGLRFRGDVDNLRARATLDLEAGRPDHAGGFSYNQATFDGQISFPTFGNQQYRVEAHGVVSSGETPPHRYAYLGGPGTIVLLEPLELGGDYLLFVDGRYDIPLPLVLGTFGPPTLTLRQMLGSAGVGHLPRLEQRVGVRLTVSYVRLDVLADPVTRRVHVGAGLSFAR
jgi:hypothetical protein